MNKTLQKNRTGTFITARIIEVIKDITSLTGQWIPIKNECNDYNASLNLFENRYSLVEGETAFKKLFWALLLMCIPALLGVDYVGIQDFFSFIGSKLNGVLGNFVSEWGFIVFLLFELIVGAAYVNNNIKNERKNSTNVKTIIINALMISIVLFPAAIILYGYKLDPIHDTKKLTIAITLSTLSFLIHLTIYLTIENVINAITYYLVFLPKKIFFNFSNPAKKLLTLSENLKFKYIDFDTLISQINEYEESNRSIKKYKLGHVESILRDKIENTFDYESIEVFDIESKNLTSAKNIFTPSNNGHKKQQKVSFTK